MTKIQKKSKQKVLNWKLYQQKQKSPVQKQNQRKIRQFKLKFIKLTNKFVKQLPKSIFLNQMMRSMNSNRQIRLPTNSQQNEKTKKLGLTSSNSKNKNMSSSVASMTSSLKKSTYEVKSTKKTIGIGNSTSNKSLKSVKDIAPSPVCALRKNEVSNKQNVEKKGSTIPVKNIKQRICGVGLKQDQNKLNTTILTTSHQNNSNMTKKLLNQTLTTNNQYKEQKTLPNQQQKHYYYAGNSSKDLKMTVKPREKSGLMDFTAQLVNTQQGESLEQPPAGLSLDQFELGRKLGKGRFGDVFMARQIHTGFALAIKIINKKELRESQMQKQLIQQIKIQMYSNHPNILKMYGFFSDKNKIYLLLQLATNGCLFKQIRKKSYLPQNLASFYFRQVTSGVRYLHSHSVIHRDIKPENILNCFNVLKLCDFGWAIYSPIYQRQTFCGTLDYVPPQIVTGQFYDQKADVWCLGVLCYELCTGKAPFQSTTDENETYDKILKVNIEFPIYLSQQIVDFIGKILTRDPSKRINLEQVESHEWMRMYENETGRMISKEIWDKWMELTKV